MSEQLSVNPRKLILIDGYGFVFRAYHALSRTNLTRSDGTPVGAVFAFTNMLLKILTEHETDYMAVIFDAGKKTFRNDIYTEYKANRPPAPDDLIPQFPLVREAVKALNIAMTEQDGYEADDLIATYARIGKERGYEVVIISSDKDLMQLVGDGIEMLDPLKSRKIGVEQVVEKFGVEPDRLLDVLSLMGDSSDNVPGVPGIGPKTAAELVNRFGSLDDILKNTSEIAQKKRRATLEDNAEKAILSRDLIRLCSTVPVESDIEDFLVKPLNEEIFVEFLKKQGFKSLATRFEKKEKSPEQSTQNDLLTDIDDLSKWVESIGELSVISIHFEFDTKTKKETGMAISVNEKACYLPLNLSSELLQTNLFGEPESEKKGNDTESIILALRNILEDPSILKISHDFKGLIKVAKTLDVNMKPIDDIMMMSYTLEAGLHNHDLNNIIIRHHSEETDDLLDVKTFVGMEPEKAMFYICKKTDAMLKIHKIFKQRLISEKQVTLYEKIEKPLINVLADMENAGIKIDPIKLKNLSSNFDSRIITLEEEIHKLAECEFNIGSPKQMGEVLFDKLQLKGGKKSKKTGAFSTDVKVLQNLADEGNEIAEKILQWRHFSKIKNTYTDALPKQIKADGRVHTHFSMAITNTGRLSSHDPNIQNIPVRTDEGNKIREAFIAEKGYKLISADYSQIELRLLAHMADISILQEAFRNNDDIHSATASQIFGINPSKVDSELRRKAKMINFGIIYGISAFGLAQRLGIDRTEAADYIKRYFAQYPGIEAYMKKTVEFARKHNYVETIWGRRCYINGINDTNQGVRQFSERAAINAPLQGSAADIIKKAMIILDKKIKDEGLKVRALLQVHDELILEAPENEAEKIAKIVKDVMEKAICISVPTTVDVGVGDNWREIH